MEVNLTQRQREILNKHTLLIHSHRKSIRKFVFDMWGLSPQHVRPEYQKQWDEVCRSSWKDWERAKKRVRPEWFGLKISGGDNSPEVWHWYHPDGYTTSRREFIAKKQYSWQQNIILIGVEKAMSGDGPKKISTVSGHGCHTKGTPILMFDGTIKKVEDVIVGDTLMGDDSTPRSVLSLARGQEQIYRIKYHDGSYYDVNESHILSLVASQTHGRQTRGDIVNVTVREYLSWSERKRRTHIGYKKSVTFCRKEQPIEPYLLGLWLGDGTSDRGEITNPDKEIIEYLLSIGSRNVTQKNHCPTWRVPQLKITLKSLNLLKNKHIPLRYLTGDRQQRLELLAGLLDTDGHLDRHGTGFQIYQKKKEVAEGIVYLARSLGIHATCKQVERTCTNAPGGPKIGQYWYVHISRNIWLIPTRVERKKARKPHKTQRENLHYGFTVEKLEYDDYYGFEIDGNNLYLLGDFTVTHNTGKSTVCSWIILWFLYCFYEAQVPVTAPTSSQMHDVLWKELSIWINKMPDDTKELFRWTSDYIRMNYSPESWFARARTSTKENTEAIAGVHSDHVAILVDESSGVPEQVFETAQGALTSGNVLIVMISNGTRTTGYFYDSHHKNKEDWQCASFNCEQSPIVDERYPSDMAKQYGYHSQEYKIRVKGEFPDEDSMDDSGYLQLIPRNKILVRLKTELDVPFVGRKVLGVDPAGEGHDKCTFVLRDRFKAECIKELQTTNDKEIAEMIITFIQRYELDPHDVVVGAFGVGSEVGKEVAIASKGRYEIYTVQEGNAPKYEEEIHGHLFMRRQDELQNYDGKTQEWQDLFLNIRALMNFRARNWIIQGGQIVDVDEDSDFAEELARNRYKRSLQGAKIQMMPKQQMLKLRLKSPNKADALGLSFLRDLDVNDRQTKEEIEAIEHEQQQDFDKFRMV